MKTLKCMYDASDNIKIRRLRCRVGEIGLLMSKPACIYVPAEDAIKFAKTLIKTAKKEIKAREELDNG